ncbi:MAG: hypothetical protein J3R72DRAFT_497760 [Linnemannia gamsii]|nr:MAG: hypothetical protein J3R72DRAFT_497760 [Linnemannia gamsii]
MRNSPSNPLWRQRFPTTMAKSIILLGFTALAASSVSAASSISFWTHEVWQANQIKCPNFNEYNRCYSVSAGLGIRSGEYVNGDPFKSKFSVTLYTGPACNGVYDRWSFTRTGSNPYGWDHQGGTTNNVQSFKVADFATSNVMNGNAGLDAEYTVPSGCRKP